MFVTAALAQSAPGATAAAPGISDMLVQFAPILLLVVIFWFLIFRPQQKRAKEQRKMISEIAKGDEVIAAGILGRVENVGEHFLTVEVADNVHIRVQKGAVSNVLPKGTLKSS